jgi:hypothetical protein
MCCRHRRPTASNGIGPETFMKRRRTVLKSTSLLLNCGPLIVTAPASGGGPVKAFTARSTSRPAGSLSGHGCRIGARCTVEQLSHDFDDHRPDIVPWIAEHVLGAKDPERAVLHAQADEVHGCAELIRVPGPAGPIYKAGSGAATVPTPCGSLTCR